MFIPLTFILFLTGDVVRFGPNRLLFRTSTALKGKQVLILTLAIRQSQTLSRATDIYGFGQNIRKSAAYHQFPTKFAYSTHNAVDKNMHRRKRKLVNQAFTKNALKIWETSQLQQIRIMCNELIQPSSTPSLSEKEGWSSPKKMSDYGKLSLKSGLMISGNGIDSLVYLQLYTSCRTL